MTEEQKLNTTQIIEATGVSRSLLQYWINKKKLPSAEQKSRSDSWYILLSEVKDYNQLTQSERYGSNTAEVTINEQVYVPVAKAANLLGMSKQGVHYWIGKKLASVRGDKGEVLILLEDVTSFS